MQKISNQKALIDRQALIAKIEDKAFDASPDDLQGLIRSLLSEALKNGEAEVRRRLHDGADGREVAKARSFLVDQIIRVLFDFTLEYQHPITNPTRYAVHVLRETLLEAGIPILGAPKDIDDLSIKPDYTSPALSV